MITKSLLRNKNIAFLWFVIIIILQISLFCVSAQQQKYVPVRIVNENDTPIKVYHYDSNTGFIDIFGDGTVEVAGKGTTTISSHPGHVFVSYNIHGLRLDKYTISKGYDEGEQIITVKDTTKQVEAIFHNAMPQEIGTMDVYWLNFEDMTEEFNAKIPINQQVKFMTKPNTKFAVYNQDRTIRIEYTITATIGQSQLVIIDNRVDLLITNNRHEKIQVYWKEILDNSGDDMATIHPIGYVDGPGGMFSIKSKPEHAFVAYSLTKDGKNRKDVVDTFTVTAKMGEKQTFIIGRK